MSELSPKVTGVTIGVRFARSFRIPDMSGEIIDNILRDSESPFDTDFFPKFGESADGEKILLNDRGDNVKITSDDLIFTLKSEENFDEKYIFIKDRLVKYLIYLCDLFQIEDITRIGVLYYSKFSNPDKFNEVAGLISNKSVQKVQNFNLSFTQKKPVPEGLINKNVNDYINIIYSLVKSEESDTVEFKYDYQKFFDPSVSNLKNTKLEGHFENSFHSFNDEYEKWIKNYDNN